MKIPEKLSARIKKKLWDKADQDDWLTLSDLQKTSFYEHWSTDGEVGGVLSQYLNPAQIRVYLKDTIMKPYARQRTSDEAPILRAAGLKGDELSIKSFEKPHGRLLFDKKVVCWGPAQHWKSVILAVYERSYHEMGEPHAAVLVRAVGKMAQPTERAMVEALAVKIGIAKVIWRE
jgi:hypothetical protein